jgi:hypothetical protein
MKLFNRDSRKTSVAQPTLRSIDFLRGLLRDFSHGRIVLKPLLSILGLAILVDIGPVALNAVVRVSLVLIQIFLGLCQLSLAIFQILDM